MKSNHEETIRQIQMVDYCIKFLMACNTHAHMHAKKRRKKVGETVLD